MKGNNAEALKKTLLNKLKEVKTKLASLKSKFSIEAVSSKASKMKSESDSYITNLKSKSATFVEEKEKLISNREIISIEFIRFLKKIKEIEKFNQNLGEILINSLANYNKFLLSKLPFYKEYAYHYIINNQENLCNNNIFTKLKIRQINQLLNSTNNKTLFYYLNGKYPLNIKVKPIDNFVEDLCQINSLIKYRVNKVEIKELNDELFKDYFNKDNFISNTNNIGSSKIVFQQCEFKNIDISNLPIDIMGLSIIESKLFSTIFDKIQFQNLSQLILDNNNLDNNSFENIFTIIARNYQISKNIKYFSAKNNLISRLIKQEELKRAAKFISLEIFNLANNNISDFNNNILKLIPNIKILDLYNNSLIQEYKCKEMMKNCKGVVILIKNIGIMKESMNTYYEKYYTEKISKGDYPFYSINLDSLYYKRNYEKILQIDFENIKKSTNLIDINFSSCNIDENTMITLLEKCLPMNNNILKMDLSYNLLTQKFFTLILEKNLFVLLSKLNHLDLAFNLIGYDGNGKNEYKIGQCKKKPFVNFLKNLPKLEKLIVKGTRFEEKINEYVKNEIILYEKEKIKSVTSKLDNDDLEIRDIFEFIYVELSPKFNMLLNCLLTEKYSKRIRLVLPRFYEHVTLDNQ